MINNAAKERTSPTLLTMKNFMLRSEMIILYILLLLVATTSIVTPSFLSVASIMAVLKQYSFYAIMAVPLTFLMVSLAFDMSIGMLVALPAGVAAVLMRDFGISLWVVAIIAILLGTGLGMINGFLHGVLKINAFIATLSTDYVYKGLFRVLTNQATVDCHISVQAANISPDIGRVPISIIILIVLAIVGHIILKYTKFGRSIYIIGNSLEVAREVGISETKVKLILYSALGAVGGLCSMVYICTYSAVNPGVGDRYEFFVNAGTVIGGCSIYGGKGTIAGSLIGAAVMTVVQATLRSIGVPSNLQVLALGVILLSAILIDTLKEKKKM